MPRKTKSNIGRSTKIARRMSVRRVTETSENRGTRLETNRIKASTSRAAETSQHHDVRVADRRARASTSRAAETPEERTTRHKAQRSRQALLRIRVNLRNAAFNYDKYYDYGMHRDVVISPMATL